MTAASAPIVLRAHGGGGTATAALLDARVFAHLRDPRLLARGDSAVWDEPLAPGARLAMTTDAYVVTPLFFPGGDLGRLAVCGTVNDLAVAGARPLALSLALVLEEGLPLDVLDRLVASAAAAAVEAGVGIVTGDTKVVEAGRAGGGAFAVTSGVGAVPPGRLLSTESIRPGDAVLLTGPVADHGVAVMVAREDLGLSGDLRSDSAPLSTLVEALLAAAPGTRFIRDATRGGVATVLCDVARAAGLAVDVEEGAIPIRPPTRAALEILGLDPLTVANEGVLVAFVPPGEAEAAVSAARAHPRGAFAARIGTVRDAPAGRVVLATAAGGRRIVLPPYGEELPRIC